MKRSRMKGNQLEPFGQHDWVRSSTLRANGYSPMKMDRAGGIARIYKMPNALSNAYLVQLKKPVELALF